MAKREYIILTEDDSDDHLVSNIASREVELHCYETNIELYKKQLALMADIPDEMPSSLVKYKGKTNEQIIAMGASPEDALLASQCNHKERVKTLLFTEQAECRKSDLVYQTLLVSLPKGTKRDAALTRYKDKEALKKLNNGK